MGDTLIAEPHHPWRMEWRIDKYDADAIDCELVRERSVVLAPKRVRTPLHPFGRDMFTPVVVERLAPLWTPKTKAFEVVTVDGNLLLNNGINRLEDLLIVAGGQGYNNANSRIGLGDDSTAAAASQTDLQAGAGSTHRQWEVMDATFPSRSSQTISWRSTFATGEANYAVAEAGVDVGTVAGTTVVTPMLNRKVTALGTKTSAQVWQVTATLVIS